MANYTVTLAEIIRDMADPKIPNYDFSGLIKDTWEKIVPTKFPMWEEDTGIKDDNGFPVLVVPRERLVCKILAHYFTWEIGYENQNMWLFAFNRKLSEIMPYYVQLEKTMGIDFNPFITTDIEERFGGDTLKNTITTGEEGTNSSNSISTTKDFTENVGFTGEREEKTSNQERFNENNESASNSGSRKNGSDTVDRWYTTDNTDKNTTKYGKIDTVGGHIGKDTTKIIDEKDITKDKITYDTIDNVNTTTTVTYDNQNTHTKTGTVVEDSDDWNKFSATPQGTLTDVETGRYLTDARKVENDKTTTYDTTDIDKKTGKDITTVKGKNTKTGTDSTNTTVTRTGNDTIIESTDNTSTSTLSGKDVLTVASKKEEHTSDKTTYGTLVTENNTERGSRTSNNELDGSSKITDKNTTDKSGNQKDTTTSTGKEDKNTSGTSKETGNETYLKTIKGRNSQNIVDQIEKWRELIVNIEMMIINDMQDLFMQVF